LCATQHNNKDQNRSSSSFVEKKKIEIIFHPQLNQQFCFVVGAIIPKEGLNNVKVTGIPSIGYYSREDSRLSTREKYEVRQWKRRKKLMGNFIKNFDSQLRKGITRGERRKRFSTVN
jgi:hypothetical protein